MVEKTLHDTNLSKNQSRLYISQINPRALYTNWKIKKEINWDKYQIKETDMRIKTATFTSPVSLDLTNGQYAILITSPYHEDFGGIILSVEYDRKTGMYNYQCQDWTRKHQVKINANLNNQNAYNYVMHLITNGITGLTPTKKQIELSRQALSGLRPVEEYDQKKWGSVINFNPLTRSVNMIIKNKNEMELIRDFLFESGAYVDVYADKYGIVQIEPYHKDAWLKGGLTIDRKEISDIKIKFDTTNIITEVVVTNNDDDTGKIYRNNLLMDFFGKVGTSVSNSKTTSGGSAVKSTGSATSNPYGNKAKKVWINSDNGSGSMKNQIANLLKQKGWDVHIGGTCSNCHYSDYFNVTSDYQVYATLYNGFCAGTVREAYSSRIQNTLNKKGVVLVIMWDSSGWTSGMKPYRYGDFSGYNAGRAWDDNFSSSDPSIKNVGQWLKSNNAKYCVYPNAEGIVDQFLAGGYFAQKGV